MEGLKLGDLEQAYYAELFQTCDVEGTGKITGMKASELFLASSLHQDALKQVSYCFLANCGILMLLIAHSLSAADANAVYKLKPMFWANSCVRAVK